MYFEFRKNLGEKFENFTKIFLFKVEIFCKNMCFFELFEKVQPLYNFQFGVQIHNIFKKLRNGIFSKCRFQKNQQIHMNFFGLTMRF